MEVIETDNVKELPTASNQLKWVGLGALGFGLVAYLYTSITNTNMQEKASGIFRWLDVIIGVALFIVGVMLVRKVF